jgi:uncharacterized protein with von Willebrand factor type A (vWA) domain
LLEFRENHAGKILNPGSIVMIISDGFDSNNPGQLAGELKWLKSRCDKVVWLNPMLERQGFNAEKDEVWNIRRNVDHLLPAHSLEALRNSIRMIR